MPDYGPSNGIMGEDPSYELPEYQAENDAALAEYAKKARFSRTAEYKELKDKLESRIEYYQGYLPGNIPPEHVPEEERGKYWGLANLLITEFKAVIASYELAYETIKEETRKREAPKQEKA